VRAWCFRRYALRRRLPFHTMQNPIVAKRRTTPATAMPTLSPSVRPWSEAPELLAEALELGLVMFTPVLEKREPWIEMVCPATGCCWHAASNATTSMNKG
jgi:hypothetical protein